MNNITTLEPFSQLSQLKELYLRKNKIADIEQLFYLENCKRLRILWLQENPIANQPDYRHRVLAALPWLHKLDNIEVSPNEVSAAQEYVRQMGVTHDYVDVSSRSPGYTGRISQPVKDHIIQQRSEPPISPVSPIPSIQSGSHRPLTAFSFVSERGSGHNGVGGWQPQSSHSLQVGSRVASAAPPLRSTSHMVSARGTNQVAQETNLSRSEVAFSSRSDVAQAPSSVGHRPSWSRDEKDYVVERIRSNSHPSNTNTIDGISLSGSNILASSVNATHATSSTYGDDDDDRSAAMSAGSKNIIAAILTLCRDLSIEDLLHVHREIGRNIDDKHGQ